jgi:hypothetical protein
VEVLDLLVHLAVLLEVVVVGGAVVPVTLGPMAGQLVPLLDFLAQMTGLVQCKLLLASIS